MNKRTLSTMTIAIILAAAPVRAQHGGMHEHDPAEGGAGHHMDMGGMNGDQMMNHMNEVMDQMGEMMMEMHSNHAEIAGHLGDIAGHDHQDMHADMMHDMSGELGQMMTAMQSMFEHMQGYMDGEAGQGDAATMGHMNEMMENLERMMQAGNGMMSTMTDMNGPDNVAGHETHQK